MTDAREDSLRHRPKRTPRKNDAQVSIPIAREGLGKVVLVAEQRARVRAAVCSALEKRGYTVFQVENGVQALHLVMSLDLPPDLIVAERDLDSLPARELVNQLSIAHKLPKVIVMSADAIDGTPARVARYIDEMLEPPPAA